MKKDVFILPHLHHKKNFFFIFLTLFIFLTPSHATDLSTSSESTSSLASSFDKSLPEPSSGSSTNFTVELIPDISIRLSNAFNSLFLKPKNSLNPNSSDSQQVKNHLEFFKQNLRVTLHLIQNNNPTEAQFKNLTQLANTKNKAINKAIRSVIQDKINQLNHSALLKGKNSLF